MKLKIYSLCLLIQIFLVIVGCKKYLEAKSDDSLVIINNLQDLQSLMDNSTKVNKNNPSADMVSSDEYYLNYNDYQSLAFEQQRNMYMWAADNLFYPYTNTTNDWTQAYNNVYIANTVLDNMDKVERSSSNAASWDNIKGQALFLRGYMFYKIASIWSLAYDDNTATTDLGIPLRLSSNFNEKSVRSSVLDTYKQIISDVNNSVKLLANSPIHIYRSSKPAAYALLAKVYLSMRKYDMSALYADSCLQMNSSLIDYNTLNASATYPLGQFNKEILYDTGAGGVGAAPVASYQAKIDTVLFASYLINDLRKTVFFSKNIDGSMFFRGSYEGTSSLFNGIAIDEVYLIRAESFAKLGSITPALSDLNTLLKNRYKIGTYITALPSTSAELLSLIRIERQKELIMRGTRWTDIKRLNKEGLGISLKRMLNGKIYNLPSNDLRFALPIPDDVISLSGMKQNLR